MRGNVLAAIIAGVVGHFIAREFIFYAVAVFAILSMISILSIRDEDIDPELARGAEGDDGKAISDGAGSGWRALLDNRSLLIFALSVTLFHFANAAMLPLAGQYMAAGAETGASLYMSACIIIAQMVMIPVAKSPGNMLRAGGDVRCFLSLSQCFQYADFFTRLAAILTGSSPYRRLTASAPGFSAWCGC